MSIEVSGVNKKFGDFVALEDVSVSIPTGQLTALLSPSSVATMDFIVNAPKAERTIREDS